MRNRGESNKDKNKIEKHRKLAREITKMKTKRGSQKETQKTAEENICRGDSLYGKHIPATVFVCLSVHITRYVGLDERSATLTGRMNQDGCNTLCAGRLQRLIATQQQLENTFYGLN